jgi:hypothetical protein
MPTLHWFVGTSWGSLDMGGAEAWSLRLSAAGCAQEVYILPTSPSMTVSRVESEDRERKVGGHRARHPCSWKMGVSTPGLARGPVKVSESPAQAGRRLVTLWKRNLIQCLEADWDLGLWASTAVQVRAH